MGVASLEPTVSVPRAVWACLKLALPQAFSRAHPCAVLYSTANEQIVQCSQSIALPRVGGRQQPLMGYDGQCAYCQNTIRICLMRFVAIGCGIFSHNGMSSPDSFHMISAAADFIGQSALHLANLECLSSLPSEAHLNK